MMVLSCQDSIDPAQKPPSCTYPNCSALPSHFSWAGSPQSSDWPWLRNVSTSATLAKGGGLPPDSKTVMAQLQRWFDDYNSYHPHSALGYLPPTFFRENNW